jgi:Fe-Mn family superoxide dismutase
MALAPGVSRTVDWTLPPLPYATNALEPHVGAETVAHHYEKLHAGYLKALHDEIGDTPLAESSLEELVVHTRGKLFNLAAQVWNHTFYWRSMSPAGGGSPPRAVRSVLERSFGSVSNFRHSLVDAAVNQFGSGYAWMYRRRDNDRLVIESSNDADTPFAAGHTPVVTLDVWEHAYYLDYRHERRAYAEAFLDRLIDWSFVQRNLERR